MAISRRSDGRQSRPPHVVFLNWRDSRHPQAGGAELYCESVARRMAARGMRVTLVTSRPPELPARETIEGVRVCRRGGTFSVYAHALAWLARHRGDIDAVIDCQNGIPFFSPLVVPRKVPVVCLVFHVHQEQFGAYFRWPMDRVGRLLEGPVSRLVYGRRAIVAISPSTRAGVRSRLKLKGVVHVVPCGADAPRDDAGALPARASSPHIACVGRLVPHKRMLLLIEAIPEIARAFPDLTVSIAGTGPELEPLRRRTAELELGDRVTFHGRVSNEERERLLAEAWLTVNPSAGEGWGLSVIEANALGVPAVAFRVPGLQDSIVDRRTGWLVDPGRTLATVICDAVAILADRDAAQAFSAAARRWARGFSWDTTTTRLLDVLAQEERRLRRAHERSGEQRRQSDVACHVSLPAELGTPASLEPSFRRTDIWVRSGDRVEALMPGTDERGVRHALRRIGAADAAQVRVARPVDWLLVGGPLP